MRVTMLIDAIGCPDGYTMKNYIAQETYDLPDHLANNFISAKFALPAKELNEKSKKEPETKALGSKNYQNKAVKPTQDKGESK